MSLGSYARPPSVWRASSGTPGCAEALAVAQGPQPEVRAEAALGLGAFHVEVATTGLIDLLQDKDPRCVAHVRHGSYNHLLMGYITRQIHGKYGNNESHDLLTQVDLSFSPAHTSHTAQTT